MENQVKPKTETVMETIAEFDRIGLEAFLIKYEKGHHPTTHLLRWKERNYPMKALWVASHRPAANPSKLDYREALKGFPKLGFKDFVNLKSPTSNEEVEKPTPGSIFSAMDEFVRIGTSAFLEKYTGGAPPKSKYVKHDSLLIPMKALWAASHIPFVHHRDFGYRDAEPGFRALGFTVQTIRRSEQHLHAISVAGRWPDKPDDGSDIDVLEMEVQEGERARREVDVIVRHRGIVLAAKTLYGFVCMGCDFDFGKFYGAMGNGFIEAHHVNPLSPRGGVNEPTSVKDFAMLCSNCHRMVHTSMPCLTVDELKGKIKRAKKALV
jgi:hypothetical protein